MFKTKTNIFKKKHNNKITSLIFTMVCVLWVLGFIWFVFSLEVSKELSKLPKSDGVVVLTGGQGRVAAGVEALQKGYGKKLLISGVNSKLASETIYNAISDNEALSECCIDLGREAIDTIGNAREAAFWAANQNFKSILLITADYHMPRALIEFKAYQDQFQISHQVVATDVNWSTLVLEYSKFLVSLFLLKVGSK